MVKRKFFTSPSNRFVTSCVLDAQNCGIRSVLWWCGGVFVVVFDDRCFCGKMQVFCGGGVVVWSCFCGGVGGVFVVV